MTRKTYRTVSLSACALLFAATASANSAKTKSAYKGQTPAPAPTAQPSAPILRPMATAPALTPPARDVLVAEGELVWLAQDAVAIECPLSPDQWRALAIAGAPVGLAGLMAGADTALAELGSFERFIIDAGTEDKVEDLKRLRWSRVRIEWWKDDKGSRRAIRIKAAP